MIHVKIDTAHTKCYHPVSLIGSDYYDVNPAADPQKKESVIVNFPSLLLSNKYENSGTFGLRPNCFIVQLLYNIYTNLYRPRTHVLETPEIYKR